MFCLELANNELSETKTIDGFINKLFELLERIKIWCLKFGYRFVLDITVISCDFLSQLRKINSKILII